MKRSIRTACARLALIGAMILGGVVAGALTPAYSNDSPAAASLNGR